MSEAHAPDPHVPQAAAVGAPGELVERFLARLIDWVILAVAYGVVGMFLIVGLVLGSGSGFLANLVTTVVLVALGLGYFTVMESTRGQTVGKMVMKLKVVDPLGGTPTTEQALKRNIWMGISLLGIIPLLGAALSGIGSLVAVIMIAVGINNDTAHRQGWHDKFADGTRVIKAS